MIFPVPLQTPQVTGVVPDLAPVPLQDLQTSFLFILISFSTLLLVNVFIITLPVHFTTFSVSPLLVFLTLILCFCYGRLEEVPQGQWVAPEGGGRVSWGERLFRH